MKTNARTATALAWSLWLATFGCRAAGLAVTLGRDPAAAPAGAGPTAPGPAGDGMLPRDDDEPRGGR